MLRPCKTPRTPLQPQERRGEVGAPRFHPSRAPWSLLPPFDPASASKYHSGRVSFMPFPHLRVAASLAAALACLCLNLLAGAQQSSSSSQQPYSSSSQEAVPPNQAAPQEKSPTLDPAGPTIALIPSESLFVVASALNACGYDEGLKESSPVRNHVRDEMNQALPAARTPASARRALPLHRPAPHDRHRGGHRAVHLAGPLSDPSAGEMETSPTLPRCRPTPPRWPTIVPLLKRLRQPLSICTASGLPLSTPTTSSSTSSTILSRR